MGTGWFALVAGDMLLGVDQDTMLLGRLGGYDCGTGYRSLSYLEFLPFTAVRIAGESMRHLDGDVVDRSLVTVVGVARKTKMLAVAEQVERPVFVGGLRTLGADDGPAHHLGRPRPLAALL